MALWLHHGHPDHLAPCADGDPDGHRPDILGTRCELCGIPAGRADTRWERDQLAAELIAAYQVARARADGQVPWLA